MEIKLARSKEDFHKCWKVVKELRPHLKKTVFAKKLVHMIKEGYVLAYIEVNGVAASTIGFRYFQLLFNDKHYYIDDLSTLPEHRGKGYGGLLLDYIIEQSREMGFKSVTLDSGFHRINAHRLYLNKQFVISSLNFTRTIDRFLI